MSRCFYSVLMYLLLPFSWLKLQWRGRKQPAYRQHLAERYGFYAPQLNTQASRSTMRTSPVIWLHCVSVGETRAAAPLVAALRQDFPDHNILLTHGTPTGRATSEQLYGDQVTRCYLPYDTPDAVARFLQHFQPVAGALLETELWFNLIAACEHRKIPLYLLNARMSAKSMRGYARFKHLSRQGLRALAGIAAQSEDDATRLKALGASQVVISGNLKFDVQPAKDATTLGQHLRNWLGSQRPVFLAASTREGEEVMVLEAVQSRGIANLLTVIVPRHPQRFDEVASLLASANISFLRRSKLSGVVPKEVNVILGDSLGEMFTYYAACDLAFIGGSLLPFGGQNLIEACRMGKPVLLGPHTFNFSLASKMAIEAGAARQVADVGQLAAAIEDLLACSDNRSKLETMGRAASEFSLSAGGATQIQLKMLTKTLGES